MHNYWSVNDTKAGTVGYLHEHVLQRGLLSEQDVADYSQGPFNLILAALSAFTSRESEARSVSVWGTATSALLAETAPKANIKAPTNLMAIVTLPLRRRPTTGACSEALIRTGPRKDIDENSGYFNPKKYGI
ncbi:MAG TPA: hypothetical protein VKV74_14220 [Bryobacteraceae bacterium]|nr:hypothetical protein [Bryobacteraceae bacterium]